MAKRKFRPNPLKPYQHAPDKDFEKTWQFGRTAVQVFHFRCDKPPLFQRHRSGLNFEIGLGWISIEVYTL